MTLRLKLTATILILGFTTVVPIAKENHLGKGAANLSNDEKVIRYIIENQYPGFVNAGDAKGYASQFTEDALWMPPGVINQRGPEAIAKSLNEEFKTMRLSPVITINEISVLGDHAFVIGRGDLTIISKQSGDKSQVVYTVFWFLRKVDNRWKIARQIWNEKPMID